MKIASRLMLGATVLTALAVVGSAGTTGWLALNHSSQAVEAALQRQFQTTAAGREEALLRQFESFGELLQSQAHSRMTQEALYGFVRPFDSYRYEVPATINIAELREQLGHWYQDEYIPFHRRTANIEMSVHRIGKAGWTTWRMKRYCFSIITYRPTPVDRVLCI